MVYLSQYVIYNNVNRGTSCVRKRSQCLLLAHQKRVLIDLSKVFGINKRTLERWFDSWSLNGVESFLSVPGEE